jgi:hypothetical protein
MISCRTLILTGLAGLLAGAVMRPSIAAPAAIDVKSFKVVTEKLEADKAAIAVTITGARPRTKATGQVVHYDFVRDGDKWKIDDIKGSDDGTNWSIRGMLEESLKT